MQTNLNINLSAGNTLHYYTPDKQAAEWCAVQHLNMLNGINNAIMLFILAAIVLLIIYDISREYLQLREYSDNIVYIGRMCLYIAIFLWLVFIKYNLVDYVAN